MKLDYKKTVLVGFAFFLISAFWSAYDAIVPLALTNHYGLPQTISGVVMSVDNILAVFMLPLFGALSDKVITRFGKRTPFIVIGTVAAVIAFVLLTVVNGVQIKALDDAGVVEEYSEAEELYDTTVDELNDLYKDKKISKSDLNDGISKADKAFDSVKADLRDKALDLTLDNIWPLMGFIGVLLVVLIAMATFRSPAVALMPDVTVKPLRSKANAVINLMGTAGGIIVLLFSSIFGISDNLYMSYLGYVIATSVLMLVGLAIFIVTVKERKWSEQMEEDSCRLGLNEEKEATPVSGGRALDRAEMRSLLLILASVALWYIGYNSITSKYSVYSTNVLGVDYGLTLIVAQAAAIVSYIPVGIIASRFGRRKTILAGITMLSAAFFIGNFIGEGVSNLIMYPIFVLAGIGWATINVNSFPMVVELAGGGDVGKYTGYYYTASMAAQIVAPILSGALYDLFDLFTDGNGMRVVFFAFGTVFVALSFVTMFFVKHGDARPERSGVLESLGGSDD